MINLKNIILEVENKWFNKLYNFSKLSFNNCNLPSHDHNHHLRVWHYCKEIIINNAKKKIFLYSDVENLIIASFMHDIGMTKTLDIIHGIESGKICDNYFNSNKIVKPERYLEIIDAIEKHDDKNYKKKQKDSLSTLAILSIADDLDAFGVIGILRYIEIYYLRDNNIFRMPRDILRNLEKRYANFITKYFYLEEFNKLHTSRYLKIHNFFSELQNEIEIESYSSLKKTGAVGFLNIVLCNFIHNNIDIESFCDLIESKDVYINRVKEILKTELEMHKL